jgi:hypothetical protein
LDIKAKKMGLNLEKSLERRLDVGKHIASQLDNAQVTIIQHDGFKKYKDLEAEERKEAFDQDALAMHQCL